MGFAGLGYQKLHPYPLPVPGPPLGLLATVPCQRSHRLCLHLAIDHVQGMQLNFVCPDEQLCLFKFLFGEMLIQFQSC
jgi:hypothetical protein